MSSAHITALYRYPVKGFSPEPLPRADIAAGDTIPYDRAYAIENGPSGFNADTPSYRPKIRFLMLMRNERMASYQTRFDEVSGALRIFADGALQAEGALRTEEGRRAIEAWLAKTFQSELRGPPKILAARSHSFSDEAAKVMHLVNLASVRELEARLGRPVDPLRFRPNIVIDGAPAFSELDWQGLNLPKLKLAFESRTRRCAATNVDPATGRRDMDMPRALETLYGHADFGIYLRAITAGSIAVGDPIEPSASAQANLPL